MNAANVIENLKQRFIPSSTVQTSSSVSAFQTVWCNSV